MEKDFAMLNLTIPSGITADDLSTALKGTALSHLAVTFVEAERRFRINALYLCAHAIWNSAWGMNKLSREKFNLFGFHEDPEFPRLSAKTYVDMSESIYDAARVISTDYLTVNGKHFNGPDLRGLCVGYANSDETWEQGVNLIMNLLLNRMRRGR